MSDSKLSAKQIISLREHLLAVVHAPAQDIQVRMSAVQALLTYEASVDTFDAIIATYGSSADHSFQLSARAKTLRKQLRKRP